MSRNQNQVHKKMMESKLKGLHADNSCIVDLIHDSLSINEHYFGFYEHKKSTSLEIASSKYYTHQKTSLPHVHFFLTEEFVYLNGGFFPFLGTDFPQNKRLNTLMAHLFVEMLYTLQATEPNSPEMKIRGLYDKYRPEYQVWQEQVKGVELAFKEVIQDTVNRVEDSQYYLPKCRDLTPLIDTDTFERTLTEARPKATSWFNSCGTDLKKQYGQYIKQSTAYNKAKLRASRKFIEGRNERSNRQGNPGDSEADTAG